MGPVCAGGLDCKLTPYRPKDLDNNYIRGYNCIRDTTYRSPRTSRLSPTAQRQAGGTLPESHPTTQHQLPYPPACSIHSLLPIYAEVARRAGGASGLGRVGRIEPAFTPSRLADL